MSAPKPPLIRIGWREWVALPDLDIPAIRVKVDTGARTSALHATDIELFEEHGQQKVRFQVHPVAEQPELSMLCEAVVIDQRHVTSSSGQTQTRWVIATTLQLADQSWPIELTLTNRKRMKYRMLLGRTAMAGRVLINPKRSYVTENLQPIAMAFHEVLSAEK